MTMQNMIIKKDNYKRRKGNKSSKEKDYNIFKDKINDGR